jgi:saccharopine dehydrogenase (NADP+, L-glutamate forming)/spermidine synthase
MKKALVLGAGLVAKPLINYLLNSPNISVTVASKDFIDRDYIDAHPQGSSIDLDIANNAQLEELIMGADIVVSLLPYTFHLNVAKLCIKHKKNMTTASYVSDDMKALDSAATEAGIVILNELGLDPGIDHMSAMEIIDRIHKQGGTINSFRSNCGGLPFWNATTTPFQYKFSWSPAGVLLAAKNSATYKENGSVKVVPNKELFSSNYQLDLDQFGVYEVYPNRDSIKYINLYGLDGIDTIYRGTIRNMGWCDTFSAINKLDLLDDQIQYDLTNVTYAEFMAKLIDSDNSENIQEKVADFCGLHRLAQVMNRLDWLGLFSEEKIGKSCTRFQVMLDLVAKKLSYAKGERDMVLLHHEFKYTLATGEKRRTSSLLLAHGDSHESFIMSKTVGLPLAIATRLVLENKINLKGVQIPVLKEIYTPILDELAELGIEFMEKDELDDVTQK